MKRWILVVAILFSPVLAAGEFEQDVKDLGDTAKRLAAVEKLAKAGSDAYDDLLDGLKQDPDAEGISADEKAQRRQRRLDCARLLGSIGDTRAAATLTEQFKALAIENTTDAKFAGACASAIGRIWGAKEGAERTVAVAEFEKAAANSALEMRVRWGALRGLESMGVGGTTAAAIATDANAALPLRVAAIRVLVEAGHKESAGQLLDIWETQNLGPKNDEGTRANPDAAKRTSALGLAALYALSAFNDERAVPGLVDVTTLSVFGVLRSQVKHAQDLMQRSELKPKALDALVEVLKDDTKSPQYLRASQTLGEFGSDGVKAFLSVADVAPPEGKPETHYRDRVDQNLRFLTNEKALNAFAAAYRDLPDDEQGIKLREKIVEHMLNHRQQLKTQGHNLLRDAADNDKLKEPQRAQCIGAYAEAKGKDSLPDLKRWVKSENGAIRAQAVDSLGRTYIPLKDSKDLLVEAAKSEGDDFANTRKNALKGLQRSDDKALLPIFIDALNPEKEPNGEVREAALTALDSYRRSARVKDDDVFPAVKARIEDADSKVRATAIRIGVNMAQLMGQMSAGVEMVEKGLADSIEDVRVVAYQQVSTVSKDIKAAKVIEAALTEQSHRLKGEAVTALSRMTEWGEGETRRKVLDIGLEMLKTPDRNYYAADLLKKASDAANFNHVTEQVRAQINDLADTQKQYDRIPTLLDVLIALDDSWDFDRIMELGAIANGPLRRKCADFIAKFGTARDIPLLKDLQNRTDATGNDDGVRKHIDTAIQTLQDRG
jgi:hypothetical protein